MSGQWRLMRFIGVGVAALSIVVATEAVATLRTVVLSGQIAPDIPNEVSFGAAFSPRLNDAGDAAFLAQLVLGGDVTTANGGGVWSEIGGSLGLTLRIGDAAGGVPGGVFSTLNPAYVLTNSNHLLTMADLRIGEGGVTASNNSGIWSVRERDSTLVLREGSQAPGTPDGAVFHGFTPVFHRAGHTTVASRLRVGAGGVTAENDMGIWSNRDGPLTLLARTGDAAPGLADGAVFQTIAAPRVNAFGRVAFPAVLKSGVGGVTAANDLAIWSDRSGPLETVVQEGDAMSGVDPAARIETVSVFTPINIHGAVAFAGRLQSGPGGVTAENDLAIWADGPAGQRLVARKGQQAPGLPTGVKFRDLDSVWSINDAGATVFITDVGGMNGDTEVPDGRSLWSEGLGSLALVAREGDQAADVPAGVHWGFINTPPLLNNRGQVLFRSSLQGAVTTANDLGIWASDGDGNLRLIAREGQMIELAPSDTRQIAALQLGDFDHRGQVAFEATFTDGASAALVSSLVAIPLGDYDGNGTVGPEDYDLWKSTFGSNVDLLADGNGDGVVDAADFTVWRNNYFAPVPEGAGSPAVPEPSIGLLIATALAMLTGLRKRSVR